jgi:hypothetical protein
MDLQLTDEQLKQVVNCVAKTSEGLKLLGHLISISGVHNKGMHGDSKDIYNKGRADYGREIIEMMELYAFKEYVNLQNKDIDNKLKEINENGR